jgi:Zn ribbon nucleic-acid-binding protein
MLSQAEWNNVQANVCPVCSKQFGLMSRGSSIHFAKCIGCGMQVAFDESECAPSDRILELLAA